MLGFLIFKASLHPHLYPRFDFDTPLALLYPLSSVKTDPAHLRRQGRSKLDAGLESSSWSAVGRLHSQVIPSGRRTARPSPVGIGRPTGKPCQLTRLPMPFAVWSAPDSET